MIRPTPILQRWQPKEEQEKRPEIQMELENISQEFVNKVKTYTHVEFN